MISLKRLVLISRPLPYIPSLLVFMKGYLVSHTVWSYEVLLGGLIFTFPMGLIIYGINDIADRESDAANPRKGGVDGAVLRINEARQLTRIIGLTALLCAVYFLATHRYGTLIATLAIYAFAYTYSVKPFRLKSRPFIDSISNGLWIASIFVAGFWSAVPGLPQHVPSWRFVVAVGLFAAAYHALTSAMDYDVDKKSGDKTISVALGTFRTLLLCSLAFLGCLFLLSGSHLSIRLYLLVCALLSLGIARTHTPSVIRQVSFAILALLPVALAFATI